MLDYDELRMIAASAIENGLLTPPPVKNAPKPPKPCRHCEKPLLNRELYQVFCSANCRRLRKNALKRVAQTRKRLLKYGPKPKPLPKAELSRRWREKKVRELGLPAWQEYRSELNRAYRERQKLKNVLL
jgi:hypothetical protein